MRTAVILGGAACVWTDLEAYTGPRDGVVACNDVGKAYSGDLTAWVSMHPEHLRRHAEAREAAGYSRAPLWSKRQPLPVGGREMEHITGFTFPGCPYNGASGMFAAKVAIVDLGFDMAVLCGIPMVPIPHFYGGEPWRHAVDHRPAWENLAPQWKMRMRSMSGWTRELLGGPNDL